MNKLRESIGPLVYDQLIRDFFNGIDGKLPLGHSGKGNLWISHFPGFDTLVWEPWNSEEQIHTGQYEIAVRILVEPLDDNYKYPGYVANDGGYLLGKGVGS